MAELTDAEVFGTAAPANAAPKELSDAEVFGAPAPQSSSGIKEGVTQAATGFNEGLAKTAIRAADVIPYFASRAMGGEGVHPFEGAFRKLFVEPAGEPQTPVQRVARAGGDMAGENMTNLVPGAMLAKSGIRSGVTMAEQAGPGILDKVRGAADAVLEWMSKNSGKAASSDTMGAFQAGAGGQVGRQVAENAGGDENTQRGAELAGQLLTPSLASTYAKYAPTVLTGKAVPATAKLALQNLPEEMLPAAIRPQGSAAERAADGLAYSNREGKYADPNIPAPKEPNWITRQMDAGARAREEKATAAVQSDMKDITARPEARANMAQADALKQDIPGFNPGLAKETGDPALLNLQRRLEGEATGNELRAVQDRTDASRGAVSDRLRQAFPSPEQPRRNPDQVGPMPASEKPQDIVAAASNQRTTEVTGRLENQRSAVQGQLRQQADGLPEVDRIAGGGALRQSRDAAQRATDAETTRLRGSIADPDTVIELSPAVPATKTEPAKEAVTATLNQVLDRRAAINQEMRDYTNASARSVDDVRAMRRLQNERDHLDGLVEGASDNVGGLREYTNHYKNENVPQFRQGASAEVGRRDSFGYEGNRVDPERVAGKFFNPNEESAARQFNKSMGHDPNARQQMIDHALDDIRHNGIDDKTGTLKQGFVDKWMRKNERVLNELPFVREAVQAKNPDELYSRIGQVEQRQRRASDTKAASLLGKNPEQQIDAALNDWQIARSLKRGAGGDANTEKALARAVMDRAPDAMDPKFPAWVEGHKRVLSEVLTPKHLADIQTVIKAAGIENQLPRAVGSTEVPKSTVDKAGEAVGLPIKSVLQRFMAAAQGRVGVPYTAMDMGTRVLHAFTGRQIDAVWREALFNPKVANDLATITRGKGATPIQLNRLHNYLLTVGAADTGQDYPHQ